MKAERNPTVSPSPVLANPTNDLMANSPTSVNHLNKSKTFTKRVQREGNKVLACPKISKTWDNMTIPDELQKTASGVDFMVFYVMPKPEDEKLVIGFCSPSGLETLDSVEVWFGDGTFDI